MSDELRIAPLSGRAWTFTDDLCAADILPLRCAELAPAEAARALFGDLDPAFASRIAGGDVLVAGRRLGHGAGGLPAARALAASGMLAVVAGSYADGFDEALLAAGLPPLEVDAPNVFHTGNQLRLNLEGGAIANLSSGDRQPIRNLTDPLLARLRAMLGR